MTADSLDIPLGVTPSPATILLVGCGNMDSAMLAGLKILDEEDALVRLMGDTIAASAARNDEMTRAFRPQTLPQEQ